MPKPRKGEKQSDFISRCVPIVISDKTAKDNSQATAICDSMYKTKMTETIPVKELMLTDETGLDAIALVEYPAIEMDFLMFENNEVSVTLARIYKEKQILTGPAMIPDKQIYRYNQETDEEYYVYFTKETVELCSQKYLEQSKQSNVNFEHEVSLPNITLIESWIVTDTLKDKSAALGYSVPIGTWMISMKVNDSTVWNNIVKKEMVKGFSIEGFFVEKFAKDEQISVEEQKNIELLNQITELLFQITE